MATKKKKYFLCDGLLYEDVDHELFSTGKEVEIEERANIFLWKGAPFPLSYYLQIISFFRDGYTKTNSENLVFAYYNFDTHEWLVWAPPQICSGMTVKLDRQSKDFIAQREEIPADFIQLGTFHHHCTGTAFASGTDKSDEEDRDGLHVTVGGIGQTTKPLTLHCRATFSKVNYDVELDDFLEFPEWLNQMPLGMRYKVYNEMLTYPAFNEEYPKQWLDNCSKPVYQAPVNHGWGGQQQWLGRGWEDQKKDPGSDLSAWEQQDVTKICKALKKLGVDPVLAESIFEDTENDPNLVAIREQILDECRALGIHPGRVIYLFNSVDIPDFDLTMDYAHGG